MRKSFASLTIVAGLLTLAGGQAVAAAAHSSVKTVSVVMHDPGCHWFSVGGKYVKTLTVKGPVALANYDEKTLIVAGPSGVKHDPTGAKVTLRAGTYTITMIKQAHDDNTLKLVVE
jgi:hypothetical protein